MQNADRKIKVHKTVKHKQTVTLQVTLALNTKHCTHLLSWQLTGAVMLSQDKLQTHVRASVQPAVYIPDGIMEFVQRQSIVQIR